MKYNPHVHCIVTEGGFDRQWNWIHTYYLPYKFFRKKWQYNLLTMLNPEGFVINAEHRFEERIRFILSVIKINENGKGASIEKVISEAAKIGMNREHAISYIEHLKQNGYTYEPINGEIKCAF